NELSKETTDITPIFLKNRLQLELNDSAPKTKKNQKLTFSELVDRFIEYKDGNIKAVTLRSYKQASKHLKSFQGQKGRLFELDEIDSQFHKDFVK
ncbi:MAG: phage integrase SAM-like domain-containing protein, partial [Psychroflexus sp.]